MSRITLQAGDELHEAVLLADQSMDAVRRAVNDAVRLANMDSPDDPTWDCYVVSLFPGNVAVYRDGEDYFRVPYEVDQSTGDIVITLGTPTEVELGYIDSSEPAEEAAQSLAGDLVPLIERALSDDGTMLIKAIDPGWGSSGHYAAEVLRRDGPRIYPAGTHMFLDHPSASESRDRPERSLRDLAAVTVTAAEYQESGPDGAGLYVRATPLANYAPILEQLAPHIGVSIRAQGYSKPGEAEGRKGPVITSLERGDSIDFVTRAGRGGKVLQLFESARNGPSIPPKETRPMPDPIVPPPMAESATLERFGQMQEAMRALQEDNRRMREQQMLREGETLVQRALSRYPFHELTRTRLAEGLVAHLPLTTAGEIDTDALATQVKEAAQREADYLTRVGGAGTVRDLGPSVETEELTEAAADKHLDEALSSLWGSPSRGGR